MKLEDYFSKDPVEIAPKVSELDNSDVVAQISAVNSL